MSNSIKQKLFAKMPLQLEGKKQHKELLSLLMF